MLTERASAKPNRIVVAAYFQPIAGKMEIKTYHSVAGISFSASREEVELFFGPPVTSGITPRSKELKLSYEHFIFQFKNDKLVEFTTDLYAGVNIGHLLITKYTAEEVIKKNDPNSIYIAGVLISFLLGRDRRVRSTEFKFEFCRPDPLTDPFD